MQEEDFMDDEELARDSAAIDRLLSEAKADLVILPFNLIYLKSFNT